MPSIENYFGDNDIAASAQADVIRPQIASWFHGEVFPIGQNQPNMPVVSTAGVAVHDYIVQCATWFALNFPENHHQHRFSQVETGKQWILGYLSWYRKASALVRNEVGQQPDDQAIFRRGVLKYAKRHWPKIPWSDQQIWKPDSLFFSPGVTAAQLDRVDTNLYFATVVNWQVVRGWFGFVELPRVVKCGAETMTLGWEVVHDWILPKDATHGVSVMALKSIMDKKKLYDTFGQPLAQSIRPNTFGYQVESGGLKYIIAIGKQTGDIVTCYRVT